MEQKELIYTLNWKSKQADKEGKSGNYNSTELDQKVFNLKERYSDLEYWIESVK